MLRRHKSYFERVIELYGVPPIEFAHAFESKWPDEPRVAGCSKHGWGEALPELLERLGIRVVIVIMAEEDDIDCWQVLE